MSIVWAIIVGFFVGLFARALMPGRDVKGFVYTTLLGVGGSLVGKYLGQGLGLYHEGEAAGFFMSLIGAMFILFLYHHFGRKEPTA